MPSILNTWPVRAGLAILALLLTGFLPPVGNAMNAFGLSLVERKDYWPAGIVFRYLALIGHVDGTNNYGVLRYHGLGMSWNHAEGSRRFAAAMAKGSPVATYNYAMSPPGEDGADQRRRGAEILKTLSDAGDIHATAALGVYEFQQAYKDGEMNPDMVRQALAHLQAAADTGDIDYKLLLARHQMSAAGPLQDTEVLWFTAIILEDVYQSDPARAAAFIAANYDSFDRHPRRAEFFFTNQTRWDWYKFAADNGPIEASCELGGWANSLADHPNRSDADHLPEAMPYLKACASGVSNSPVPSKWEAPPVFGQPALYLEKFVDFNRYFGPMDGWRKRAAQALAKIYETGKGGVPQDTGLARRYARLAESF